MPSSVTVAPLGTEVTATDPFWRGGDVATVVGGTAVVGVTVPPSRSAAWTRTVLPGSTVALVTYSSYPGAVIRRIWYPDGVSESVRGVTPFKTLSTKTLAPVGTAVTARVPDWIVTVTRWLMLAVLPVPVQISRASRVTE